MAVPPTDLPLLSELELVQTFGTGFALSRHRRFSTFIHLVVCLTTGPKPLPKRALHIVRSRASSFK